MSGLNSILKRELASYFARRWPISLSLSFGAQRSLYLLSGKIL